MVVGLASRFGSYVFMAGIYDLILKHACKLTEYMSMFWFFLNLSVNA